MAQWLWQFWIYSFLGYLLEKGFAVVTGAQRRARRCSLLLPLCPVYGMGAMAVLALPPELTGSFWGMALWGGAAATVVEYVIHLAYERLLGVRFWDYKGIWGNLGGRVCVPFSLIWSLLLAAGLPVIQPWVGACLARIPAEVTYGALLVFTGDALISARILWRTGDPESVRPSLLCIREKMMGEGD